MPFPHDPSEPMMAEAIAVALESTLDGRGRLSDPEYQQWFAELLNECSSDALPVFRGEGLPHGAAPVLLTSEGEVRTVDVRPEPPEPDRGG
ncbi:hypothetical protein [Curtobacterium sp. VKM Ac-2922]|uniref:hypothetical protein n=1 Tax=Curtobacterium sp. VKM Ac-2922 TaxID=2929475 RepID=UPI001FB2B3A2|nr:hypothetical protein [Curtobacterium sp. VKM Ac-2922]MCJ1715758.1 hypothetical protein [Curtobacterium sp. VKM Ac-2922]